MFYVKKNVFHIETDGSKEQHRKLVVKVLSGDFAYNVQYSKLIF